MRASGSSGDFRSRAGACGPLLLLALTVLLPRACPAAVEDPLLQALREHRLAVDTNRLREAALRAMLRAVDPGAELLPEEGQAPAPGDAVAGREEWPENIGYLAIRRLDDPAGLEIAARLREWAERGFTGVVLDARGAGGDSLEGVTALAALFAKDEADLFLVRDATGKTVAAPRVPGPGPLRGRLPLVLLVDQETRGASEALAAVMKTRCGVLLVGCRTAGDSAVRSVVDLPAGRRARLATGWIETCEGRSYEAVGVAPDVSVRREDFASTGRLPDDDRKGNNGRPLSEKARQDRELMRRVDGDLALRRAADILLGLRALHGDYEGNHHSGR